MRAELGSVDYRPRARVAVRQLAELTAAELGLPGERVARVRLAAQLCDTGRERMPPHILEKRGPLTREEWIEVRRQPELAAALLSDASFDDIREWILSRRERVDGTGYPRGLRGEQIPLEARILAVPEAYVAMTSDRAHAPTFDHAGALLELLRCAGTQFDAAVVDAFVRASTRRGSRLASVA